MADGFSQVNALPIAWQSWLAGRVMVGSRDEDRIDLFADFVEHLR